MVLSCCRLLFAFHGKLKSSHLEDKRREKSFKIFHQKNLHSNLKVFHLSFKGSTLNDPLKLGMEGYVEPTAIALEYYKT